ncbi:unnamed protein product, partial [Darwinula stevensoni]
MRDAMKAIFIAVCAALAIQQVRLLVDEYESFPTNTLYKIENVNTVPPPAFTICPKPSLKASEERMTGGKIDQLEEFAKVTVPLTDLVRLIPTNSKPANPPNGSFTSQETIIPLENDKGYWNERIFYDLEDVTGYYKCFTLYLKEELPVAKKNCEAQVFSFDFASIQQYDFAEVGIIY